MNNNDVYTILKRVTDVALSVILLVIHLPVMAVLFLLVFIETHQFPVFVQERGITLNGKKIKILKFRTIKNSRGKPDHNHYSSFRLGRPNGEFNIGIVGRFLRTTCLDELPQLINVLMGDMSLIGPRPLSIEDLEQMKAVYSELYFERSRLQLKPGISGLWQLNKDDDMTVEHIVKMDKIYYSTHSLWLDFYLMIKTINILLQGKHKDALLFNSANYYSNKFALTVFESYGIILLLVLIVSFGGCTRF